MANDSPLCHRRVQSHVYEVRPRKDKRGVDLICDVLPFVGLLIPKPAIENAMQKAAFMAPETDGT
jgi:hypothetical protein